MSDHENINITKFKQIISPAIIKDQYPIDIDMENFVVLSRKTIENILNNQDDKLIVITGPCSIHDYDAALEYGRELKKMTKQYPNLYIIMRVYFEKPRTNVGWKGFINDPELNYSFKINQGICIARKLLIELTKLEIPIGCEFLDTVIPQYISDLVSWVAIGARTVESQIHRELASGLSMPVGFKNGTSGNIDVAIDAIIASNNMHCFFGITHEGNTAIITTKGNKNSHIILRGSSDGPNFDEDNIKDVIGKISKKQINQSIIVDCSHGNSGKDYRKQIIVATDIARQINNKNKNIKGIMLESNLVEGNQKCLHTPESIKNLIYGMSITDSCINLNTTSEIFSILSKCK